MPSLADWENDWQENPQRNASPKLVPVNYRPGKLKPVDSKPDLWKTEPATMSNKARQPKNFVYPENTAGTKAAKRVRSEANKLTERQREDLFKRGMQIIYGGTGTKETVGAGH